MKKMKLLIALLAVLFNTSYAMADEYTDGLRKLVDEGVLSIGEGQFSQMAGSVDMNGLMDATVEIMAPYYRDNMTLDEFNQMMEFQLRPDILEATKNIVAKSAGSSSDLAKDLQPAMMTLIQGGIPEDVKLKSCDPAFMAKLRKYLDITDSEKMMSGVMSGVKDMLSSQMSNVPAAQKAQAEAFLNAFVGYIDKNMMTITTNVMIESVSEENLDSYLSIADQPFFPAWKKANSAMMGDFGNIMKALMAKIPGIANHQ